MMRIPILLSKRFNRANRPDCRVWRTLEHDLPLHFLSAPRQ